MSLPKIDMLIVGLVMMGAAPPAAAATIQIERTFSFDQHTRTVSTTMGTSTIMTDTYVVEAASVVLPNGSYDRIELTLRPENGLRFTADTSQLVSGVDTFSQIIWSRSPADGSILSGGLTFVYTNASGSPPTPSGGGVYGISNTRQYHSCLGWFRHRLQRLCI